MANSERGGTIRDYIEARKKVSDFELIKYRKKLDEEREAKLKYASSTNKKKKKHSRQERSSSDSDHKGRDDHHKKHHGHHSHSHK
ncbi:7429_t:CDS:2, partial [Racocetra fulgida]